MDCFFLKEMKELDNFAKKTKYLDQIVIFENIRTKMQKVKIKLEKKCKFENNVKWNIKNDKMD